MRGAELLVTVLRRLGALAGAGGLVAATARAAMLPGRSAGLLRLVGARMPKAGLPFRAVLRKRRGLLPRTHTRLALLGGLALLLGLLLFAALTAAFALLRATLTLLRLLGLATGLPAALRRLHATTLGLAVFALRCALRLLALSCALGRSGLLVARYLALGRFGSAARHLRAACA